MAAGVTRGFNVQIVVDVSADCELGDEKRQVDQEMALAYFDSTDWFLQPHF